MALHRHFHPDLHPGAFRHQMTLELKYHDLFIIRQKPISAQLLGSHPRPYCQASCNGYREPDSRLLLRRQHLY
jgi:hypothetical protein